MAQHRRHSPHFFVFFILSAAAGGSPPPPEELASLLAFKSAVEHDPLQLLMTWNPHDVDAPCRWTGITCSPNNATVISVALPKAQLSAPFPAAAAPLAALPHLRHLNLHHNKLRGSIPPSLFFNASQLQSLFLFDNLLTGEIPAEIRRLSALQSFSAARNSLSGPLPPLFPSSLRYLDLSHNSLSGSISTSFADNLPLLNLSLDLSFNNLSGAIPSSFAHLPPSAFLGNPSLCGFPLSTSCAASSPPAPPVAGRAAAAARLGRRAVAAIAAADAAAVCIICLVVLCCYCFCWRRSSTTPGAEWEKSPPSPPHKADALQLTSSNSRSAGGGRSAERAAAASTPTMEGVYGELVALGEERLEFNLEELLKASAYVLGKGRMGIVYRVSLSDHLTVAVRRLGDKGAHRYSEFKREVETIGGLRHPNIVRLKAYYWASDEKLLVYDFIPNGNLAAALRGSSHEAAIARTRTRLKIARGAARGLAFLHSNGGAHGDVRAGNVLLDQQMEAYIADYGLKKLLSIVGSGVPSFIADGAGEVGKKASSSSRSSAGGGGGGSEDSEASDVAPHPASAAGSRAPQPHKSGRKASATVYPPPGTADQKEDVYGFGLILLELVTGGGGGGEEGSTPPWLLHMAAAEAAEVAMSAGRLKCGSLEGLLDVARSCLAVKPERRPSMAEVCRSLDAISDTA